MIETYEYSEVNFSHPITYHELIGEYISPEFSHLSEEDIDEMLGEVFAGMSPEEIEGFWKSLGRVARRAGRTVVRAAPSLLPVVGGAVGTLVGGPVGTAIGTSLGGMAGGLVARAASPRRTAAARAPARRPAPAPRRPTPPRPARAPARRSAVPAGGSTATAQLLALLNNPALLQSLLSRELRGRGRTEVLAGAETIEVDFGSLMNALATLASEAARDAHAEGVAGSGLPEYLLEDDGEPIEDAGLPEIRAQRLLELMNAAEAEERIAERAAPADSAAAWLLEAGVLEMHA